MTIEEAEIVLKQLSDETDSHAEWRRVPKPSEPVDSWSRSELASLCGFAAAANVSPRCMTKEDVQLMGGLLEKIANWLLDSRYGSDDQETGIP